jgi:hypothetical protein
MAATAASHVPSREMARLPALWTTRLRWPRTIASWLSTLWSGTLVQQTRTTRIPKPVPRRPRRKAQSTSAIRLTHRNRTQRLHNPAGDRNRPG